MRNTPGPWEVRPSSNPKNGTAWRDIVSLGDTFAPSYVGEALEQDAALIAAAPEMIEALKQARLYLSPAHSLPCTDLINRIDAIIAKAEGRA